MRSSGTRALRVSRALALVSVALLGSACGAAGAVERLYDGRLVRGVEVPSGAFGYALQGAIAEGSGDLPGALAAYEAALKESPDDPALWTRIGVLRCTLDPQDRRAALSLDRALALDADFADARLGRARCLLRRRSETQALGELEAVDPKDRRSTDGEALRLEIKGATSPRDALTRSGTLEQRALALTLLSPDDPAAWRALLGAARSRRNNALLAYALAGLAHASPEAWREVEGGVHHLIAESRVELAREVAAARADAFREQPRRIDPIVARLAVDEAIVREAREKIERRAVEGRVSFAEVAARAWLLDRRDLAIDVAKRVLAADPKSRSARALLVVASTYPEGSEPTMNLHDAASEAGDIEPASALVIASRLEQVESAHAAHTWFVHASPRHEQEGDPLLAPLRRRLEAPLRR